MQTSVKLHMNMETTVVAIVLHWKCKTFELKGLASINYEKKKTMNGLSLIME